MKITGEFLYRFRIITVEQLALYCSIKFGDIVNTVPVCTPNFDSKRLDTFSLHVLASQKSWKNNLGFVCKNPRRQHTDLSVL